MKKMKNQAKTTKTVNLTTMALFTALIIIMSVTPLGYLKLGAIEISFIMLPVAVGGMLLGPWYGAALGAVFGITSFIQCFGASAFGVALLSINPFYTAVICLVPRILAGFVPALLFKALIKTDKTKIVSFGVASLLSALLNTVLFVGSVILFFWNTDFIRGLAETLGADNILAFGAAFAGVNALFEAGVCLVVGTAVGKALYAVKEKLN